MKRATTISLLLHLGVIVLFVAGSVLFKHMKITPKDEIRLSLNESSIQARIIYLNQVKKPQNMPDSVAPQKAQAMQASEAQQETYQLPITSAEAKAYTKKNKRDTQTVKLPLQSTNKNNSNMPLSPHVAALGFSSTQEIDRAIEQLQSALAEYLARQSAPSQSLEFDVILELDQHGKLQKITLSPLPAKYLQDLLQEFFQAQTSTQTLFLQNNVHLKIPIRLMALS